MSWRLRKKCDPTVLREAFSKILAPSAVALLCSCGGGGGNTSSSNQPPSISCDLVSQKSWLRDYMQDAYFWSGAAPDPNPLGYATLQSYFDAQLFTGSPTTPRDRWSYISETDSYNQFFEEGKTLGFGVAVNGQEGRLPLKVRYVEPNSPAANAGIARGETIKSINGVSDAELFASGDFSGLAAEKVGDTLTLQLEGASGARTVALVGATYALLPVPKATLLSLANGSKAGYIVLKDFITQAETPLNVAIDELRRGGATELIVDLRYNGGGRISTATVLASLIAGSIHDGKVFTRLIYNNGQTSNNASYQFSTISKGYRRVVILTGSRTCSASELLVNGLKPYLDVVTIGGQTCGKPFGFSPVSNCAKTISAVNFESTNAQGEGRYYSGLAPSCNVADDFVGELGDPKEVLASAATHYLNTGLCPVSPITLRAQSAQMSNAYTRSILEPGEFRGMRAD